MSEPQLWWPANLHPVIISQCLLMTSSVRGLSLPIFLMAFSGILSTCHRASWQWSSFTSWQKHLPDSTRHSSSSPISLPFNINAVTILTNNTARLTFMSTAQVTRVSVDCHGKRRQLQKLDKKKGHFQLKTGLKACYTPHWKGKTPIWVTDFPKAEF